MATITTEFGKVDTKKQRAVYLRLRDKKTEKRIATGGNCVVIIKRSPACNLQVGRILVF